MLEFAFLPVTPFQQNCTLLRCPETRQAVLIDPGGEAERLAAWIARGEAEPTAILLTHGHLDHVGAAGALAQRFEIPILGPHRDDQFLLEALPEQSALFGLPPAVPFQVDRWLEAGDRIPVGNAILEVLHCPGHTPGHVVFFSAADALAQVGDLLFRGSIGRTDFPRGDLAQLLTSIRTRLFALGDAVRFIPGHGPMSTLGAERRDNPYVADGML